MNVNYKGKALMVGQTCIVEVAGDLDVYTAPYFKNDLHEAISSTVGTLVVDMSRAEFIDSTALGVLVGVLRRLVEEQRGLVLVISQPRVARIFRVTGLHKTFQIAESRREAFSLAKPDPHSHVA